MYKKLTVFCLGCLGVLFLAIPKGYAFSVESPDINPAVPLDPRHLGIRCAGKNISPAVLWKNAPKETKSFALTLYDPDAPTGSGWWHWVVFNIPPSVTSFPQGASGQGKLPAGAIQSLTDSNVKTYGGPCPPIGDRPHRYILTIYALDTDNIPLDENTPPAMVGFTILAHRMASTSMTFEYGR